MSYFVFFHPTEKTSLSLRTPTALLTLSWAPSQIPVTEANGKYSIWDEKLTAGPLMEDI